MIQRDYNINTKDTPSGVSGFTIGLVRAPVTSLRAAPHRLHTSIIILFDSGRGNPLAAAHLTKKLHG